ncbi:MAG TPA: DEAD/DEAH box helicase, partial [Lacipirellulaceae bacterium]|nr:DEAD/DEAH box helicase [Lacipirellulaceae bacterium]
MKFADLPLNPTLLAAVAQKGYDTATPIQEAAIPPVLAGHDLVGCAQTGTGKTAAFALPTLHRMLDSIASARAASGAADSADAGSAPEGRNSRSEARPASSHRNERPRNGRPSSRRKTRTLVLAPTRELCSQIADSFVAYGKNTPLRYAVIFGGVSQMNQVRALQHGVDVIIATPGRLLDLMQQGHVDLSHVETLILDEADRMLDMGFIHDLRRIVARVPGERQTLMFSATMPPEIRALADEWLVNPVSVSVTPVASTVDLIEQTVYFVEKKSKVRLLRKWLENTASTRTLVFARTKHGADKIVKELLKSRIFAAAIHGNKSQSQREKALAQFKSSRPPVLVATDIAARGIDVAGVSHVVNYDLPIEPETYVHRIGRTGRAGAAGIAVSFCSVEEVGHLRSIERLTRRRIDPAADHAEYDMTGQAPAAPAEQSRPRRSSGNGRSAARSSRPAQGRGTQGRPQARPQGAGMQRRASRSIAPDSADRAPSGNDYGRAAKSSRTAAVRTATAADQAAPPSGVDRAAASRDEQAARTEGSAGGARRRRRP